MVETRLQERSLTEQVDEIRSLHDLLATELKSRADSLDLRFDRLEALMFHNSTQLQATGKAPMDPGPSHPPTPISNNPHHTPNQPPDPPDMTGYFDRRDGRTPPPPTGLASRLSKIKFPSFDGTHLRDWISNCEQFFNIDGTPLEIKVCLTLMHLTGKATQWHHNYMSTRFGIFLSWTEYIVAISSRFSELYDDPLAELVDLKQGSDSVVDFLDKFETARMRLVLPEAHALSIFLANLNRHLSLHTRQFEVTTEMQDRRAKGLCMFCDEVYTPGHSQKHKRSQIFVMEGDEGEESPFSDTEDETDTLAVVTTEDKVENTPVISVNALNVSSTFNCMRVIGQCGKRKLYILIDNGSTHNFIDLNVANEIGCLLETITPMAVTAASGSTMMTRYKCTDFKWRMQGYNYSSEDFLNPRMEFGMKNVLRGVTKNGCKVIKGSSLNKLMLHEPQTALLQVVELSANTNHHLLPEAPLSHISTSGTDMTDDQDLQHLLGDFAVLFDEPTELPPFRDGFDHRIPLESGANPVNLRPYRYSSLQKDAGYLLCANPHCYNTRSSVALDSFAIFLNRRVSSLNATPPRNSPPPTTTNDSLLWTPSSPLLASPRELRLPSHQA
ncbi:hypothetical protein YC2023_066527 [Brassica napus]